MPNFPKGYDKKKRPYPTAACDRRSVAMRLDTGLDGSKFTYDPARWEKWLAQTAQALVEIGSDDAAAVLLACRIEFALTDWPFGNDAYGEALEATMCGPMSAISLVHREDTHKEIDGWHTMCNPLRDQITEALNLVLAGQMKIVTWIFRVESAAPLPTDWRSELNERLRQRGTTNQGVPISDVSRKVYDFGGLRYGSASEVAIAKHLDSMPGVMYFPNCAVRVHRGADRQTRYPDFLVCFKAKWGILEVDGKPFHEPTRKADDNERDRQFHRYGVRAIYHFDANRCLQEPQQVVAEFLDLLTKNG